MAAKKTRDRLAEAVRQAETLEETIEPRCRHFGRCGGCDLQHLPYPAQLRLKSRLLESALAALTQTAECQILDPVPAADQWRYRNRIELTFDVREDGGLALGYSPKRQWWQRIDVEECWLCSQRMLGAALAVKQWAAQRGLLPYDQRRREGFLRNLVVRESRATGDLLLMLVTTEDALPDGLLDAVRPFQPSGIVRIIHTGPGAAISYERTQVLAGRPFIRERTHELAFTLSPQSFFQTNSAMVSRLLDVIEEAAQLRGDERMLDLFCGVGTIGLALAGRAREVVGVECVEQAVAGARDNAAANGIENARFVCATARSYLREHHGETCDVVILDPPRPGCSLRVIRRLLEMRPPRIVYVSCNPDALAQELSALSEAYDIGPIQPVDLFPQTLHIESVVALTARG